MKILHALVLAAALAVPASAQQMGSVNRNAPKLTSSIEFGSGAKAEISYTSLNFADGMFMKRIKESEQFRNFVNQNAVENPLGSCTVPAAMMVGGKQVDAGSYDLHFLASEGGEWILTLSQMKDGERDVTHQWRMPLKKVEKNRKRLAIMLLAGDEPNTASIYLHFGTMAIEVPITPIKKKD